jgi:hypothetical protein
MRAISLNHAVHVCRRCRKCASGADLGIGSRCARLRRRERADERRAARDLVDRQMAELMVENWDRDEPDRAGELHVESIDLAFGATNESDVNEQ